MLTIFQADIAHAEHRRHVRALFWEYLGWANARLDEAFGIRFDIAEIIEQDMADLQKFAPPHGRLLLADYEAAIAGLACMRPIGAGVGEIKRMYVRPAYRRRGIGRALLEAAIREARRTGYATLRLDSARFMKPAQALYRDLGFAEIAPYPESEIPEAYRAHWVFMELPLQPGGPE